MPNTTAAHTSRRRRVAAGLPDFPWDSLVPAQKLAAAHPGGAINLSVGTPVDEVSPAAQKALAENSAAPGYPATVGTPALREAIAAAMTRRYGSVELNPATDILPVIGTKEAIGWLPTLLGIQNTVVIPELAYPTYEVAALMAGQKVVRADSTVALGPERPGLIFLNSPGNPTGKVLGAEHLRKVVEWARERGTIVVSDECYLGLGWSTPAGGPGGDTPTKPISVLHPDVNGGSLEGIIAVHSLSKTSNMASYRSGWLAGDPALIEELLAVRKHLGFMVPGPIQAATVAALNDDAFEALQKDRYRARREVLSAALREAGFTIEHSEAGLYLWATQGVDCWETVNWFAQRGIVVAPGEFYGPKGQKFVRIALTGTDEGITAAAERIAG